MSQLLRTKDVLLAVNFSVCIYLSWHTSTPSLKSLSVVERGWPKCPVFSTHLSPPPVLTGTYCESAWIQHTTSYKRTNFCCIVVESAVSVTKMTAFTRNCSPFSSSPEHMGSKSGRNLLLHHSFWSPRSRREKYFSISSFLLLFLSILDRNTTSLASVWRWEK